MANTKDNSSAFTYILLGLGGLFLWKRLSATDTPAPTGTTTDNAGESIAASNYSGEDDAQQVAIDYSSKVLGEHVGPDGVLTPYDSGYARHPLPPIFTYQIGDQIELPWGETPPTPPTGTQWYAMPTGTRLETRVWTLEAEGTLHSDFDNRLVLSSPPNPIDNGETSVYGFEQFLT